MTNGEKLRIKAQELAMLQRVATAMVQQNNTEQALEILGKIKSVVAAVHKDFGVGFTRENIDVAVESLVVYVNGASFVYRTLCDIDVVEAIEYGIYTTRVVANHISGIESIHSRALPETMKYTFLTLSLGTLLMGLFTKDMLTSNIEFFSMEEVLLLQGVFVQSYEEIRLIAPDSPVVKSNSVLYQIMSQNVQDYKINIDHLAGILHKLETHIRKHPLYSSPTDAEERMSKYDSVYNNAYWKRMENDYIGNNSNLDFIFDQYRPYLTDAVVRENAHLCNFHIKNPDFNWCDYPESLFEKYEDICRRLDVQPLKHNKLSITERIPYITMRELEKIHREVIKTFYHLREYDLYGMGSLSDVPDVEEVCDFVEHKVGDDGVIDYLIALLDFVVEYDGTVILMNLLERHVKIYKLTNYEHDKAARVLCDKVGAELGEYTAALKHAGILPADWTFKC